LLLINVKIIYAKNKRFYKCCDTMAVSEAYLGDLAITGWPK